MGLDMYLTRRHYVKRWEHQGDQKFLVSVLKAGAPYVEIDPEKVSHVIEEVAYWRKANQVHQWFVENVQGGEDDCKEYSVSPEKLQALVSLCKELLASRNQKAAIEKLPPRGGFFFGKDDPEDPNFWEWYWEDLQETVRQLEPIMHNEAADFAYQSSW